MMAGIYIKGMEMPVFEYQSRVIHKDAYGKWYMVDTNAETSDGEWHEIVPVPAHGRLIDVDTLDIKRREEQAWQDYEQNPNNEYLEGVKDGLHEAAKQLSIAPTIIPAEEDNNG